MKWKKPVFVAFSLMSQDCPKERFHSLIFYLRNLAGGKVLSHGRFPLLCKGVPDERLIKLRDKVTVVEKAGDLTRLVKQLSQYSLTVQENGREISSIRLCQREMDGKSQRAQSV